MRGRLILAHDLGTTGNKATLFDGEGQALCSSFSEYSTDIPRAGWAEQNPEDWWRAVCNSTRQLLSAAHVAPTDIACIVFSGQMMGCLCVDRNGRPLRPAILYSDQRAVEQCEAILARIGAWDFYRITGHRASASYSAAMRLKFALFILGSFFRKSR